jgi:hypothetical protein
MTDSPDRYVARCSHQLMCVPRVRVFHHPIISSRLHSKVTARVYRLGQSHINTVFTRVGETREKKIDQDESSILSVCAVYVIARYR